MLVIKHFGWGIDIFGARGPTLRFSRGSGPIKLVWLVQKWPFWGFSIENVKMARGALLGTEYLDREGEWGKIVPDLF